MLRIALFGGLAVVLGSASVAAENITFRDACKAGDRLVIAGVGDLLFHSSLQRVALGKGRRYQEFWSPMASVLASADLAYGNLEGPAAAGVSVYGSAYKDPGRVLDGTVYGPSKPVLKELSFNYHPSIITELKQSGFDVVSTANNHAADRGGLGIDRTVEAFEREALPFTGTRSHNDAVRRWSVVTEAKGFRVGWLACTFGTNGIPASGQVLECYRNRDAVLSEIRDLAADPNVDAVIFTPHWGIEKSHVPTKQDRDLARQAIEAGATAIIGTHAHVLQPWEKITAPDGREGLVIYSTGNFISNQPWEPTRHGVIAILELTKSPGSKAALTAAGYIPTRVDRTDKGHRVNAVAGKVSAILPAGNRLTLEGYRDLPRSCPPVAAEVSP